MAYEFIDYEKKGRVAYVTITRPERLNALHPPANKELYEAFIDFKEDDDVWIAIVTGTGNKAFSAGNDLRYTAENWGEREKFTIRAPFGGITSGYECYKPIIAAVNGYALGGGLELAMACDIIVMADHAEIGLPEPRVGLIAGAGGVHRLPRHIPLKRAMGMMLTAKRITAQEAYELGLANEGLNLLPEPGLALTVLEALVIQDPLNGFLLGNGNVLLDVLLGALEHEQIAHQALVRRHEHEQLVRLVGRGCT